MTNGHSTTSRRHRRNKQVLKDRAKRHLTRALAHQKNGRLSQSAYREYQRRNHANAPSPESIERLFGGWGPAVREAGGEPGRTAWYDLSDPATTERMLNDLRGVARELGDVSMSAAAYARTRRPGAVHPAVIAEKLGSWNAAKKRAGLTCSPAPSSQSPHPRPVRRGGPAKSKA